MNITTSQEEDYGMPIQYEWKIDRLEVREKYNNLENVVISVYWIVTGTDEDGVSGSMFGSTPITVDELSSSFTPLEELSENQVLEWVNTVLSSSPHFMQHIEEQISASISRQKNKIIVFSSNNLPWLG